MSKSQKKNVKNEPTGQSTFSFDTFRTEEGEKKEEQKIPFSYNKKIG